MTIGQAEVEVKDAVTWNGSSTPAVCEIFVTFDGKAKTLALTRTEAKELQVKLAAWLEKGN